jgi:hypothetical protein
MDGDGSSKIMTLACAISSFDDWSYPWTFKTSVRGKLGSQKEDLELFEALFTEASRPEHWQQVDLVLGCRIAQNEMKSRFPQVDDSSIASIVRSASYDWR